MYHNKTKINEDYELKKRAKDREKNKIKVSKIE